MPLDLPAREVAADDPVPLVKSVVLVMSGKGGVGKSTVASNLAVALTRLGASVGLLDADIYGPSVPTMFGVHGQPLTDGQRIRPHERFGVKLMSIGFLLDDPKSAVVWRGPMLHGALLQFLKDVAWEELDVLLLDLPPGTGDVALTLAQRVRSTGAVIVTTPQEVALQDVYKSVSMAKKVGIPVLGVVENESYFVCDGCEKRHELFGRGAGKRSPILRRRRSSGKSRSCRPSESGGTPGHPSSRLSRAPPRAKRSAKSPSACSRKSARKARQARSASIGAAASTGGCRSAADESVSPSAQTADHTVTRWQMIEGTV